MSDKPEIVYSSNLVCTNVEMSAKLYFPPVTLLDRVLAYTWLAGALVCAAVEAGFILGVAIAALLSIGALPPLW